MSETGIQTPTTPGRIVTNRSSDEQVDRPGSGGATTHGSEDSDAAWGYRGMGEQRWPATLSILIAIALYAELPDKFTIGPNWLVPLLEIAVIIPLNFRAPLITRSKTRRMLALTLFGAISVTNIVALALLVVDLVQGSSRGGHNSINLGNGRTLIIASLQIWLTNVIIFGLWYWELDRGGPVARTAPQHRRPDFLFPQMTARKTALRGWAPHLLDYLYLSFTNSMAFSPADTMPLTPMAKMLMLVQSLASLITIVLVAARAVNILGH